MRKLLVIGQNWPESQTTAAGKRMLELLAVFHSWYYQITFCSSAAKTDYTDNLGAFLVDEHQIRLNHSSFDTFVKQVAPDVVIFDRFMVEEQFGWRIAENCPKALRILNTEDLHSLREHRHYCLKKEKAFTISTWLLSHKTKRELASIYRSDLTLLVSRFELELLRDQLGVPANLLMHLPFMLDGIKPKVLNSWPDFESRNDFITFGNGRHLPNVDSFSYLKREIWPLIRKMLPNVRLHVYGAYLPLSVAQLHNQKEGFFVHGWVADLEEKVLQAKVMLAPLRFGAGIKGKLSFAMQCGTPNVTTTIGAEGIQNGFDWSGAIADNPNDFAERAVKLYTVKDLWLQGQKNGIVLINTSFSKIELSNAFLARISELQKSLPAHRTQNHVGILLQQQQMAATKYMGKWIEEKNKNHF